MTDFATFKARMAELRKAAEGFADKEAINAQLDQIGKLWEEAAAVSALRMNENVQAALAAIEKGADTLAWNILNCDTSKTSPDTLLSSVVKYQALATMRNLFFPTGAEDALEGVAADLEVKKIAPDAMRVTLPKEGNA